MLRLNPSLWPGSGWVFAHSGINFSAPDRAQLVEQVARHYALHSIPGDAAADVEAYICACNPQMCRESNPTSERIPPAPRHVDETLTQRRLAWLDREYQRFLAAPEFVDADEVSRRGTVCEYCPSRMPDPSGCAACVSASAAMRAQIVNASKTPGPRRGTCGVDGADIPVATRINSATPTYPVPSNCWRKNTQ